MSPSSVVVVGRGVVCVEGRDPTTVQALGDRRDPLGNALYGGE